MSSKTPPGMPPSEYEDQGREFRAYLLGGVLSLLLTVAAFALVWIRLVSGGTALGILGFLAILQVIVHFRYFLHIDLKNSHRDDLQLILFTSLIVAMMVGGTIWILFDQHSRMMSG